MLPESLPPERRAPFEWLKANPIGSALLIRQYPSLWALIAVSVLCYLAHDALPHTFFLYAHARFGWDQRMVGYALVAVGVMNVIVQAGAVGPIVRALGDRRALYFGLGMGLAAFVLYGAAWAEWVVFAAIAFGGFWWVWNGAAQSMLSRVVAPAEQGRLQGALASVRAACQVFTPAIFNGAFALGVSVDARWAGAPMLVSAALLALAVPFALAATGIRLRPA